MSSTLPLQSNCTQAALKGEVYKIKPYNKCLKGRISDAETNKVCADYINANPSSPDFTATSACDRSGKGCNAASGKPYNCSVYCEQNYWDRTANRIPCALGIYVDNMCCKPEQCTTPVTYTDVLSWCKANYKNSSVPVSCNKRSSGTTNPAMRSVKQECDKIFVDTGSFCEKGDNIVTQPECVQYCSGDTNSAKCLELMQKFCNKYPKDPACGCINAAKPTGQTTVDPDTLVACYVSTCQDVRAYKSPIMEAYSKPCPNICSQILSIISLGAYSPVLLSDVKMSQKCSADYARYQEISASADQGGDAFAVRMDNTTASKQLNEVLLPVGITIVIISVILIILTVVFYKK